MFTAKKVPIVTTKDILTTNNYELKTPLNITVEISLITEAYNHFTGPRYFSINYVRKIYKTVACEPDASRAHSRYRYMGKDGKRHEG